MKDTDLAYLAELVRRDGDERMQSFFGITKNRLYSELLALSRKPQERGQPWRVPVMPSIAIMDVESSRHGLRYQAPETP